MNVIKQALSNQRILHESRSVQALFHNFNTWLYLTKENRRFEFLTLDVALNENRTALQLDQSNESVTLAQALLSLKSKQKMKSSNFEKESRIFDSLLHKHSRNCYALMGKAKIFFYRENYTAALKVFQKCLSLNPLLRPDPRIGIGLCYWLLERKDLANQAWQNSIQVNPENNLEAKILISLGKFDDCFMNSKTDDDFKTRYQEALEFIKASYEEDPNNEVIQIVLASYFFSKGDYDVTERICKKIVQGRNVAPNVKSDAYFWLARCKFVHNDVLQSQKFFSDSIKLNEHNLLSRVGYGQCLVVRKEIQDAIRTFEKIQESNSRILEVTYALGMLYSQNTKTYNRAIVFLEKYVKLATDQNETVSLAALLALSRVYEEKDISQSLKYLQLARDQELASGKSQSEVSYALLNNIGVFTLLKNDTQAAELFGDAEIALKEQESDEVADALSVTLKYNIARTKESSNKPEDIKGAMKFHQR
ncbi:unnamed protein product [Ambrosiozyma monospora]|uniref:Unnamed protein product n=1 Tax=Ambrosiozyma monospora TaxID=43982 RepID=A0ACB5T9T1_AMBMO|nr:unnamed protein product [Ambrosiozyma monospora]